MGLRPDPEDLVHESLPDALDAAEVQHDLAESLEAVEQPLRLDDSTGNRQALS